MSNQLDQLKKMTTVVVDSGDIESIALHQPVDATTNPSLIFKAIQKPQYRSLIDQAIDWARGLSDNSALVQNAAMKLAVLMGIEILKQIPGRVSTEVDARLSFDGQATMDKARKIIELYNQSGFEPSRILIKIASTWEGIQAARQLEKEGINCNLTLLFSFEQAQACAEAGVFLISPFVGRILDWSKKQNPTVDYAYDKDPGVQSVTQIYTLYKSCGFKTIVMGASFRNIGEIQSLAGCDRLTISPALLDELAQQQDELPRKLNPDIKKAQRPGAMSEKAFRWGMNENAMATEKLAEGIRNFTADQIKLEALIGQYI
ncbi:MAG: transaldolase [Gammaproteobacteria bacterium]|nr:transaldolase [Gammaproteobacteria bacterium]